MRQKEREWADGGPAWRAGGRAGGLAGTGHGECWWSLAGSDIMLLTRCLPLHAHAKTCAAARASGSSFFAMQGSAKAIRAVSMRSMMG